MSLSGGGSRKSKKSRRSKTYRAYLTGKNTKHRATRTVETVHKEAFKAINDIQRMAKRVLAKGTSCAVVDRAVNEMIVSAQAIPDPNFDRVVATIEKIGKRARKTCR